MGNNLTKEHSRLPIDSSVENKVDLSTIESIREFHIEEASTYWLPKDDEEQQRLTGQHFALKELYEGNLLSSVEESLDFKKGVSILDVGCGSGIWIMENTTNKNLKVNFQLQIGNILNGLPYADNTFDLVNMRLFVFALREEQWPAVINELMRVVRQGGIMQIIEVDLKVNNSS
ncbi:hypothetical protein G6F56_008661 [Rhizopus delemar]|nr:hypothetical protein G6F56_008661 [Rhizopus delemar]